jgi:hypothetical protein
MIEGARETMVREIRSYPAKPGQQYYEISPDTARVGQTRPPILRNFSGSRQTPPNAATDWTGDEISQGADKSGHLRTGDERRCSPDPVKPGHMRPRQDEAWVERSERRGSEKNVNRCSS